ncbi:MAG: branched-chain amino acid ABC transporter substrate-binding protein [Acidimicrobiales bacterium]
MVRTPWGRKLFAIALVGATAMVGLGCADDDDDGDAAPGGGFEPGEYGAVDIGPDDPIVIASLQAISGDTASLGTDQVRAIEIAIADRGGELLGHQIELQSEDDGCRAEAGQTAANRIVSDPQIVGVIGSSCSGAAVPAMSTFVDEHLVMISGSNTSPGLTSDLEGNALENNQEGYFRIAHNDIIQGQAAAQFAFDELGATTAATVHDGDPYTEGLATAFGTSFTDLGGEVVLATAVDPDATDMRPVLTEIDAAAPDIVFFPIFQPAANFVIQQSKEFPGLADSNKMMGADGLLSDTFIVLPETEGMYFSGPAAPVGAAYDDFVAKYEAEFGEAPIQSFHAHAYDATNILLDTIEEVAVEDDDGTLHIDRMALIEALYDVDGYEGLTGSLSCDEFGDCADPKIDVLQNSEATVTIGDVRANVLFTYDPEG